MEDPDSRRFAAPAVASADASAGDRPGSARPSAASSGRQRAPAQEARDAPDNRPRGKKRRKRRRGRKVFARDGVAAQRVARAGAPLQRRSRAPASSTADRRAAWPRRPAGSLLGRPPTELPVFAALDLGTNNCRLLVAVPTRPGQFRVIDAFSRIVRLGEGLSASGRLGQPAMDRAVEALKICADKLRSRADPALRLIATEACRSAENGDEFLDRVKTRDRARARDHRPRDRGAAGGLGLRLAGRARHRRRRAVRHRRRLVRNRADRRLAASARRAWPATSSPGRRCRSASSRWPNGSAAAR